MTFFWYDYETFGSNASVDRPVQFAGVRTDTELNAIGDPVVAYCRPAPDYLPRPDACLIHGITPTLLLEKGESEADFAQRIHQELSQPSTCAVGYNAVRFDHEVTRFLLYRNLRDPYGWHWRHGNSRWDIIDLVRAVHALQPDGITWPVRADDAPSFRLEDLAAANELRHDSPHEAFADVQTTIDLARLVRDRQPDLFEFYLKLRDKRTVAEILAKPFLWISSLVGASRSCATLMAPLASHPSDSSAVLAFDLTQDPEPWLGQTPDELQKAIFRREGARSPIYKIKSNACPFVAPADWLVGDVRDRLQLDGDTLKEHYRALRGSATFGTRVREAYDRDYEDAGADVDTALYDRFIPDGDREILASMLEADPSLAGARNVVFEDDRMSELVFRYRARNYPDTLANEERERWKAHCRARHLQPDEEGRTPMDAYQMRISELRDERSDSADLLDDLADYGRRLRRWLG